MLGEGLDRQGGIVSVERLILESSIPNVQFKHIATLVNRSGLNKAVGYGLALVDLVQHLFVWKPDLIHIHVSEGGSVFRQTITTFIAKAFSCPVIMHTHGPAFHVFYKELPQLLQSRLRWVFGQCDRVIALSENWRNFYINELNLKPDRVIILSNPVKIPANVPERIDADQKVDFIFLGRIGQRKGAFDLIRSFSQIPEQDRAKATLTIAGDGEIEQAQHLITHLGLDDYITVRSWLDPDQRDVLLAKSDVFVLPSYNEGLPMALLEAMSWGLPVITTPVGGIPELVNSQENGLLVTAGDIHQLTAAMELLINHEELRVALGAAARDSVLQFDSRHYCDLLVQVYFSILTKGQDFNDETSSI